MRIQSFRVRNYQTIEDSGLIAVEPNITCFFGSRNELGKTWLLEALAQGYPGCPSAYDVARDYPQTRLQTCEPMVEARKVHDAVLEIHFIVEDDDAQAVAESFGPKVDAGRVLCFARYYDGSSTIDPGIDGMIWDSVLQPRLPRVLLFDNSRIIKGSAKLEQLAKPGADGGIQTFSDLLALAGVASTDFAALDLQRHRERIESTANALVDELFRTLRNDAGPQMKIDIGPANQIRIRLYHEAHRVSSPLHERTRGLSWYFSFLIALKHSAAIHGRILALLDDPEWKVDDAHDAGDLFAFMQHWLAAGGHQVIYATPWQFKIDPQHLGRARAIEHVKGRGTFVSPHVLAAESIASRVCYLEVDHAGLNHEQRFLRPFSPRPVTFDSLIALYSVPRVDCRDVVPIEVTRAGDQQVFVAREPWLPRAKTALELPAGEIISNWPIEPIIDVDTLADVPSVRSIVSSTVIRARRRIPQVRELIFVDRGRPLDEETLACLPGLKTLWALMWPLDSDPSWIPHGLEELGIERTGLENAGLSHLAHLTELRVLAVRSGSPKDTVKPLANLTKLERLTIENAGAGWTAMANCTRLVEVDMAPRLASLRPFKRWTKLKKLTLRGRGLKSLDGIESFENLESITFHQTAFKDFSQLAKLTKLRDLTAFHGCAASAASLAILRRVLCELPELRTYRTDNIGQEMADALRFAHPKLELEYDRMHHDDVLLVPPTGDVTVWQPEGEITHWSIFENLADRLDVSTNYQVEQRLKRELERRHPDVFARLQWDTEAENVGVYAESESDILVVEAIANELIARTSS